MAHDGIFYVPTIDHNRYYAQYREAYHYTAEQAAGLDSFRLLNIETARRAYKAGVKIGMGSDAVHIMFGQNTRELGWFVQMGMTPSEALATATTNGAAILGMEKLARADSAGLLRRHRRGGRRPADRHSRGDRPRALGDEGRRRRRRQDAIGTRYISERISASLACLFRHRCPSANPPRANRNRGSA